MNMYCIIETETTQGTMAALPPEVKATRELAEQEYHRRLSYAAVSTVEEHAVVMLNAEGQRVKGECYKHEQNNG